jgi:hypothetical protein
MWLDVVRRRYREVRGVTGRYRNEELSSRFNERR